MVPTHIEHIGIAVNSLKEAIPFYEDVLGLSCYNIEEVEDQGVRTAFFRIGQTRIELLEATGSESPIARFIKKKGQGIHHIAFAVKNINEQLSRINEQGVKLIDRKSRKGGENLNIGFLHPASTLGVLMELCEDTN